MNTYRTHEKVYEAGGDYYSMIDLLSIAVDPEYQLNGMPRISDFHLKTGAPVRFRLDDDLEEIAGGVPLAQEVAEGLVYPLLSEENVAKMTESGIVDVDAGFELPGTGYNFRINAFRDRDGLAAVIRLLPPNVPACHEVGFPFDEVWQNIVDLKQGLCLITGVTGSGKSTTIASMVKHILAHRRARIITLEDPIEYIFESDQALISQREVGTHVASFASGLRSALRENPDIIYIGEMRDAETASLALSAAETGHLVFATLHTRNCVGSITRMVDMFPADRTKEIVMQMSFSMAAVLSQKLVPRADGQGRLVAMEVLRNVSSVSAILRSGKWEQLYSSIETGAKDSMITMEQCLINLYQQGLISRQDAILFANDENIASRV